MSTPTPQQQAAIAATGSVLLTAGAGTGKTATLVNRCIRLVTEEHVSVDSLLVVTFTNAAAAEMKQRLREALQARLAAEPEHSHLQQQLLLLEGAHISTLHAFCLEVIRAHFAELNLDPGVTVLEAMVTKPMEQAVARELVAEALEADTGVSQLVKQYFGGSTEKLIAQLRTLYQWYLKQADAAELMAAHRKAFATADPAQWVAYRDPILLNWLSDWSEAASWQCRKTVEALREKEADAKKEEQRAGLARLRAQVIRLHAAIGCFQQAPTPERTRQVLAISLEVSAPDFWVTGTGTLRGLLARFFEEAAELASWLPSDAGDPLVREWHLLQGPMQQLLGLLQTFRERFAHAKRLAGGLDFADLEQCALAALKNEAIANQWRQRFHHVFVDECQDINAAQDALIQQVSGRDGKANVFMVGDVKQSIYRFRLAAPELFRGYAAGWEGKAGHQVLALTENFRSREGILSFANSLFACLMGAGFGGVGYGAADRLEFALPDHPARQPLSLSPLAAAAETHPGSAADCRVELHLLDTGSEAEESGENDGEAGSGASDWAELTSLDRQARVVAGRLRGLMDESHPVWDKRENCFRPMRWSDVGLLLRAVTGRAGAYLREFRQQNIPLAVEQGDFLATLEAQDLKALLQVLDNPQQDIPLFALLRSPLVGLTVDELAGLRPGPTSGAGRSQTALDRLNAAAKAGDGVIRIFQDTLARWRKLALMTSVTCVLETVLAETHYEAYLLTLPDGADRVANVHRFLELARGFDPWQRQGLPRFLKFLRDQTDAEQEIEPLPPRQAEAVQLLSIHKSKGLEFPVVVLGGIGSPFYQPELNESILCSRSWGGLAPQVVAPDTGQRWPSLVQWHVRRQEKHEAIAEELRLLYVAVTRARDTLILAGIFNPGSKTWQDRTAMPPVIAVERVRSYAEWIGLWLGPQMDWTQPQGESALTDGGKSAKLRWHVHRDQARPQAAEAAPATTPTSLTETQVQAFTWRYAHAGATGAPGKTSASALRRLAADLDADEAAPLFPPSRPRGNFAARSRLNAADIGTAHHLFLEHLNHAGAMTETGLRAEAERMVAAGVLQAPQAAALNFPALAQFWQSGTGTLIRAQAAAQCRRELAFTAAFSAAELPSYHRLYAVAEAEQIVVQGAIDLAVIRPDEIWLVDFKTDHVADADLAERIAEHSEQLHLYAAAMRKIYHRPVTRGILYFLSRSLEVAVIQAT